MFSSIVYTDVNSEEANNLIKVLNANPSDVTDFLNFHLAAINSSIEELEEDTFSLIQLSGVEQLINAVYLSKKLLAIIESRKDSIKITDTELDSIELNSKAVVNGVEKVAELNKEHMAEIEPSELFVYLVL